MDDLHGRHPGLELGVVGVDRRRLIDSIPAGVMVVGPDERILFMNRYALDRVGMSLDQIVGRSLEQLGIRRFGEDGTEIPAGAYPVQRVLGSGRPVEGMVLAFRLASGKQVWTLANAFPETDPDGRIRQVVGTFVDISDVKRAEDAARQSEERLRIAAEAAGIGTWRHDLETDRVTVDSRTREVFGLAGEEMPFSEVLARVHRYDVERVRREIESGIASGGPEGRVATEYRIVLPGERVRWVAIRLQIHFEGEGASRRPAFSIGTCQDVTERKLADEALVRAQKLEALGTLAGGVAHEFNNILLAIRGNAALALTDLPEGHPVRKYVGEIDRAGVRAAAVVRQILGYARPQGGEREVRPIGPIVEEARALLRATIPTLIDLEVLPGDALPPVRIDPGLLQQAIVNLVKNAADAIGTRPGRVVVSVAEATVGSETGKVIAALDPGRYVRLTVADDGPGMDRETRQRAFDPFFTTKQAGGGTGLGLSVVHGIMKAHGGAATIESRPGRGTTVHLYFPAASGAPAVPPTADEPVARPRGERLLFVDDDEALVFLANEMLGRMGYLVTSFDCPLAALAAFRADPGAFDGVISDISMPRMSGFALAEEILALRPAIPVVITSGYVRPEDEAAALRLGVRALIPKPNTVDEMAGTLDRIFRGPV